MARNNEQRILFPDLFRDSFIVSLKQYVDEIKRNEGSSFHVCTPHHDVHIGASRGLIIQDLMQQGFEHDFDRQALWDFYRSKEFNTLSYYDQMQRMPSLEVSCFIIDRHSLPYRKKDVLMEIMYKPESGLDFALSGTREKNKQPFTTVRVQGLNGSTSIGLGVIALAEYAMRANKQLLTSAPAGLIASEDHLVTPFRYAAHNIEQ